MEPAQLDEYCEIFTKGNQLVSYYPIKMEHFIGTGDLDPIQRLAVILSRTVLIDGVAKPPKYYLQLKLPEWNRLVHHLDTEK